MMEADTDPSAERAFGKLFSSDECTILLVVGIESDENTGR